MGSSTASPHLAPAPPGPAPALRIGGVTPCSSLDWPGQLAAVVFLQGCPWRCTYCHNNDLQVGNGSGRVSWADVECLLRLRHGLLDGVVFSGGEPTAQPALADALARVATLGFSSALHTAGVYPRILQRCLPQLAWIALDIKALPDGYDQLTGVAGSQARVDESLDLLLAAGIPFECRTTVDWALLPPADLMLLGERLAARGVTDYAVQLARSAGTHYQTGGDARGAEHVLARLQELFPRFSLRC